MQASAPIGLPVVKLTADQVEEVKAYAAANGLVLVEDEPRKVNITGPNRYQRRAWAKELQARGGQR